jgi:hypothetical protein
MAVMFTLGVYMTSCNPDEDPEPTTSAPTELVYSPNTLTLEMGTAGTSATPTIEGTTPITYSISVSPDASGEITIDASTGVISASDKVAAGVYTAAVTATNSAGSKEFATAYTIEVTRKVNFEMDVLPIVQASCKPCNVSVGANTDYTDYAKAKPAADWIIERIKRDETAQGFMPMGGTKLEADKIALIEQWKADGLLEK